MSRKFGVEIEMVGISKDQAVRALRLVGINVVAEGYNHTTRGHWKIVPDGSVINGFEVVSPILQGEEGLEQLRTVVTALDDIGGKVDRQCGYHVHFDAADLTVDHIRAIVTRYATHEREIDAFMPASRRGNANSYCRSVTTVAANTLFLQARTISELARAQGGRYFKVNLQSYHTHGTVEFRQHSGTLNAPKAVNWVRLLEAFVAETKRQIDAPEVTQPVAAPVATAPALRGNQARLAAMLQAGPVALQTMCAAFGWQRHTARAAISRLRQAGMAIDCRHGTNEYRLQGVAQPAQPVRPAATLWAGVCATLQTFYRNRAAVLSAA